MTREAGFLVDEGALPQQVDKVLYEFGMPMGPSRSATSPASMSAGAFAARSMPLGRRRWRYSPTADRLYDLGRYGQKTNKGWYRYEAAAARRCPIPRSRRSSCIVARPGITRRPIGDDEILARCLYAAINEGAKILDEGIALRASDIDVHVALRLRLSALARRTDALCRYGRACQGLRDDRGPSSASMARYGRPRRC